MHHILCESPFISRDFYAIRPLILWHILGSYFLLIWGVGVVRIIFKLHASGCGNLLPKFIICQSRFQVCISCFIDKGGNPKKGARTGALANFRRFVWNTWSPATGQTAWQTFPLLNAWTDALAEDPNMAQDPTRNSYFPNGINTFQIPDDFWMHRHCISEWGWLLVFTLETTRTTETTRRTLENNPFLYFQYYKFQCCEAARLLEAPKPWKYPSRRKIGQK